MTAATQENVRLFMRGVLRQRDKGLARHIVYLVSQGRWGAIVELARGLKFPAPLTVADLRAVLDPRHKLTDAIIFRNQVAANKTLRERLAALPKGDWEGVCAVARGEGLHTTVAELKAIAPESFLKHWAA